MKVTLEFYLPEEQEEFEVTSRATSLYFCLYDFDQWLRSQIKYGNNFTSPDIALEEAREKLWDTMQDKGIHLDMMS